MWGLSRREREGVLEGNRSAREMAVEIKPDGKRRRAGEKPACGGEGSLEEAGRKKRGCGGKETEGV